MKFEWDGAKEQANRKKHGLDFDTASKVFFDPYVIEVEDYDVEDELRCNAIGMVDGPDARRHLDDKRRRHSYYFRPRGRAA